MGNILSAKMDDPKKLLGMAEAVGAIIDETIIEADENGLNLSAMDESHICMMKAILAKELFREYTAPEIKEKLGLNFEDLQKIMKRGTATDAIELKHEKDAEKFQVIFSGVGKRTFTLRLVDVDEEKIPPTAELAVQHDATFTLDCSLLEQAIADAEIYQDTLEIKALKEMIKFCAEGEVGDIEYALTSDHLQEADIKKDARGVFSLSFLKNIMKASKIADQVTLSIADNAPLKFEFKIGEKSKLTYFLAPRVEEEEGASSD